MTRECKRRCPKQYVPNIPAQEMHVAHRTPADPGWSKSPTRWPHPSRMHRIDHHSYFLLLQMTLIVAAHGTRVTAAAADRRLSGNGRTKDDARKLMFLETTDGIAILGYAGLGATAHGTEPADWMSAVLRGRNLPLEQCLAALANAMKERMPSHLTRLPPGPAAHNVVVPAFLGETAKLYAISIVFSTPLADATRSDTCASLSAIRRILMRGPHDLQ